MKKAKVNIITKDGIVSVELMSEKKGSITIHRPLDENLQPRSYLWAITAPSGHRICLVDKINIARGKARLFNRYCYINTLAANYYMNHLSELKDIAGR